MDKLYLIILPTQCNALIRLCLPPSQKRVKLFYIVFPLPHGGITVCTRQYPYPTTYLLDTFQSVFVIWAREKECVARLALLSLVSRSNKPFLNCVHVRFFWQLLCSFLDLKSEANAQRIQIGSKGTFGLFYWLVQSEVVPLGCAGLLV